jgi:4'-phosphopantetheinyl transferase
VSAAGCRKLTVDLSAKVARMGGGVRVIDLGGIPDGECHVWVALLTDFTPYKSALDALLTELERSQVERYLRDVDRARARVSRALPRLLLANYLGRDPAGIELDRRCYSCGQPHGKPRLAGGARPHFSVSHAGNLVAFAFADSGPVGVDVECLNRRTGTPESGLLETALAPVERRRVRAAAAADQWREFLRHWTYKEAVLKQVGVGLAHSLLALSVEPSAQPQTVVVEPDGQGRAEVRVAGLDLEDPEHVGAVATSLAVTQLRLAAIRPADYPLLTPDR